MTKRLLCIVSKMNTGGAETFLMKLYRNIDKTKYQMDFAVTSIEEGFYDKEIKDLSGEIFHVEPKKNGAFKSFLSVYRLIKEKQYKYVLKTSQRSLAALDLLAAKLAGAKVRIYRSSNAGLVSPTTKEKLLQRLFAFMPRCYANVKIAPSTEAAEYVFGKNCIKKEKAKLLKNGLDLNKFCFDQEGRNRIRKEFSIEDKLVIGHIGRFNGQKNHAFLLKIFEDIKKINPNSVLLLIGDGELQEKIKQKVKELGLETSVIFAGIRADVPQILSAMDIFVFPSYFEGMPNIILEAQTTGLPCLISDRITKEAIVCDCVKSMSLEKASLDWANEAITLKDDDRHSNELVMREAGYDIGEVTKTFINIVFKEDY